MRTAKTHQQTSGKSEESTSEKLRHGLQVSLLVILIAIPHISSSAALRQGCSSLLIMMSLLLAWGVALLILLKKIPHGKCDLISGLSLSFAALLVMSAGMNFPSGDFREALNQLWQTISLITLFLLCRYLLTEPALIKMTFLLMTCISAGMSAQTFYQAFYALPQEKASYQSNPEAVLSKLGAAQPSNHSERRHFESRLESQLPFGPFALANSLGGFLLPWLALLLSRFYLQITGTLNGGKAETKLKSAKTNKPLLILLIFSCLLTCSLYLTDCKSAWLGLQWFVILNIYGKEWRLSAGNWAMLTLIAILTGTLGAILWGDMLTLPATLRYRVEYWQCSWAIIDDALLWGCGPGNFQETYTHYQSALSSESVMDPHHWLMEVWATAGTPAALMLLMLLFVSFWQLRFWEQKSCEQSHSPEELSASSTTQQQADGEKSWQRVGAGCLLAGYLLAYVGGFMYQFTPGLDILLINLPISLLAWWLLYPAFSQMNFKPATSLFLLLAVLVYLSASSGFFLYGVAENLWVLLALTLNLSHVQKEQSVTSQQWQGYRWVTFSCCTLLCLACYFTQYRSVMRHHARISEARVEADVAEKIKRLQMAATEDPYSPLPWEMLSRLYLQRLLGSERDSYQQAEMRRLWESSNQELLQRMPLSAGVYRGLAQNHLQLWRKFHQAEDLTEAIRLQKLAINRFPNRAQGHAQLAWLYYIQSQYYQSQLLSDQAPASQDEPARHIVSLENARKSAAEALRLDEQMPHQELKLIHWNVVDFVTDPLTQSGAWGTMKELAERRAEPADET